MIPYFQYTSLTIGPLVVQVWGMFVALGIIGGTLLAYRLARRYLLSPLVVLDMGIWAIVGGFIGARLFHVFLYEPGYYLQEPIAMLKVWQGGSSSLGGFVGAAVAVALFACLRRFQWREIIPYFDVLAMGFWLGWGIGRIGCFMIHDHIGRLTDSWLGVQFSGGTRYDLGLLDSLLGFALFGVYALLFGRLVKRRWGLVIALSFLSYAVIRFFLDFLRATDLPSSDARYFYLTPAQWGMIVIVTALTSVYFWIKMGRHVQKNNGEIA